MARGDARCLIKIDGQVFCMFQVAPQQDLQEALGPGCVPGRYRVDAACVEVQVNPRSRIVLNENTGSRTPLWGSANPKKRPKPSKNVPNTLYSHNIAQMSSRGQKCRLLSIRKAHRKSRHFCPQSFKCRFA